MPMNALVIFNSLLETATVFEEELVLRFLEEIRFQEMLDNRLFWVNLKSI
jgi:hypothetical protein